MQLVCSNKTLCAKRELSFPTLSIGEKDQVLKPAKSWLARWRMPVKQQPRKPGPGTTVQVPPGACCET